MWFPRIAPYWTFVGPHGVGIVQTLDWHDGRGAHGPGHSAVESRVPPGSHSDAEQIARVAAGRGKKKHRLRT